MLRPTGPPAGGGPVGRAVLGSPADGPSFSTLLPHCSLAASDLSRPDFPGAARLPRFPTRLRMARDVSDATPIGTRAELVEWIASGEKPRDAWRLGTEHEK